MKKVEEQNSTPSVSKKPKISKNRLRFRLLITAIILFVSFSSLVAVTFAWYVYQTGAKTSDIRMAVGTGSSLQISSMYNGEYGNSALMDKFNGLLDPVSTDRIQNGFQKVTGFEDTDHTQDGFMAAIFGTSETTDYYKTTLYLRVAGGKQDIYLYDIGYEDDDNDNPISTAIRIGFLVHEPGENKPVEDEFIFVINHADNPKAHYNTATGLEGYVLDSTKTDGTTVLMERLFDANNFCEYDADTGLTTLKEKSQKLCWLEGAEDGDYGVPVQVDVYVWLEGCDKDCYNNICGKTLKKIALSFAGKMVDE